MTVESSAGSGATVAPSTRPAIDDSATSTTFDTNPEVLDLAEEPVVLEAANVKPRLVQRSEGVFLEMDVPDLAEIGEEAAFLVLLHDGNVVARTNVGTGGIWGVNVEGRLTSSPETVTASLGGLQVGLENSDQESLTAIELPELTVSR